jgi:hypothetical protein
MHAVAWATLMLLKLVLLLTVISLPFIAGGVYHWWAKERQRLIDLKNPTGYDVQAGETIAARMLVIIILGYLVMAFGILVYVAPQG